jgi:hypothetical protein
VLTWAPVPGAVSYTVQYGPTGGGTATANTTGSSITINGLIAGTSYSWQVKADCSPYSSTASFTTSPTTPASGGCAKATNLSASNVSGNSATLSWTAVTNAQSYIVTVKKTGTNKITNYTTTGTLINVSGLQKKTGYQWTVDTKCSDGSTSGASAVGSFNTQ